MKNNRPTGIQKRFPDYIDNPEARMLLMGMSKADLAEVVFDFARMCVGEKESADNPGEVVEKIKTHANAIRSAMGRKHI